MSSAAEIAVRLRSQKRRGLTRSRSSSRAVDSPSSVAIAAQTAPGNTQKEEGVQGDNQKEGRGAR